MMSGHLPLFAPFTIHAHMSVSVFEGEYEAMTMFKIDVQRYGGELMVRDMGKQYTKGLQVNASMW